MKRTVWVLLIVVVLVAAGALLVLWQSSRQLDPNMPPAQRIEYYKLYVEILKAIVVGFCAAVLGILIPAILAEAHYSFERLRDSRKAYSKAKTAGDYLVIRICALNLKEAVALLQDTHVKKHVAELYPELRQHLKRRGIKKTAEQWGDALYSRYFDMSVLLESHVDDWDQLSPKARLDLIRKVIPAPSKDRLVPGAFDAPTGPSMLSGPNKALERGAGDRAAQG